MTSDQKENKDEGKSQEPMVRYEDAHVHLRILGQTRTASFRVRLGETPLDELLPMARALSEESHATAVEGTHAQGKTLSCAKGCAACCTTMLVPVSPLEARRIAAAVHAMPQPIADRVKQRFAEASQRLRESVGDLESAGFDAWQVASPQYRALGMACPLLHEDACSVYEERPMVCASYAVTSPAEYCMTQEAPVETVPQPIGASGLLTRVVNKLTDRSDGPIPLPHVLEWAEKHGAELDLTHDGEAMFWELSRQVDPKYQEDFEGR